MDIQQTTTEISVNAEDNDTNFNGIKLVDIALLVEPRLTKEYPYQCSVCKKYFKEKWDRNSHQKDHNNDIIVQCKICNAAVCKRFIIEHMKNHASEQPSCQSDMKNHASKQSSYQSNVNDKNDNLIKPDDAPNQLTCQSKVKEPKYKRMYDMIRIGDDFQLIKHKTSFECEICKKNYSVKRYLDRHKQIHEPYECEICNQITTKGEISKHMKTHIIVNRNSNFDKDNTFENQLEWLCCSYCDKKFCELRHLELHLRNHKENKLFECAFCSKVFTRRWVLIPHINAHMYPEKRFECNTCGMKFRIEKYLKVHCLTHKEKEFSCEICGRKFRKKFELSKHLTVHTGEKQFNCSYCNNGYTNKVALIQHIKNHSDKAFECRFCKLMCSNKLQLNMHTRQYHPAEKRFFCDLCGYGASRRTILDEHIRYHNGERPFECAECGRRFTARAVIIRHLRGHMGIFSHKCQICDKGFLSKQQLVPHMRFHRRKDPSLFTLDPKQSLELIIM